MAKQKPRKSTARAKAKPPKSLPAEVMLARQQPRRQRRATSEPTLSQIKAKLTANGIGALTQKEVRALMQFQKLAGENKPAAPTPAPVFDAIGFDLKTELANIIPEVFRAYVSELRSGKGIARISAADRLREMAMEEGVGDEHKTDIDCSFIPVESDSSGKIIQIMSA